MSVPINVPRSDWDSPFNYTRHHPDKDSTEISSPFSDLAPEIILFIFQSLNSFADAFALMRTAHRFHDIWALNIPRICRAVLPNAIDCIAEAETLLAIKSQNQKLASISPRTLTDHEQLFRPIKRYIAFQRITHTACRIYEAEVLPTHSGRAYHPSPTLTPSERLRFIQCYYRLWTFVEMSHAEQAWELRWLFLQNTPMRDAQCLLEMSQWLSRDCAWRPLEVLGITEAWGMAARWREAYAEISAFCELKAREASRGYARYEFERPEGAPGVYTVLDGFRGFVDAIPNVPISG